MRVKQRLGFNTIISVVAALAIFVMLAFTAYRINRALDAANIADGIMTASYERLMLRADNNRTGSDRSREQLIAKHRQVGSLLKTAKEKFWAPEDLKTIDALSDVHEAIGRFSKSLRESRAKRGTAGRPDALTQEVEDRLLSQLNMKVYETILLDGRLQKSSREAVYSSFKLAGSGIFLFLLIAGSVALINSVTINRIVVSRINRLRDGAVVIGGGDLGHRIEVNGDDEFRELADSFNEMAAKLRGSYQDLEKEVEEHKRDEEALRRSEEMYRSLFDNMLNGFAYCRMLFEEGGPVDFTYLAVNAAFEKLTGLRDVVGKRVTEVIPGIRESDPRLFEIYGGVAVSGNPAQFETYVEALGMWFFISVYSPRKGDFVAVFDVITERKRAEEALKTSLHEKEVLLKEIHHRVKNNMQVISSLVSLQADGLKDEAVREVLKDVTYRVRSMALVHEKLYQSENLARIDFAEYSRSLLTFLWRSHGAVASPIRLNFDLESVQLPVDMAVPCGLILNELAGNALKHAFKGRSAGEVTVSLRSDEENRIRLCVADNGEGLPEDFDWRTATSLGLRLVQMLSGQIGASVEVRSDGGTRFEIGFKV